MWFKGLVAATCVVVVAAIGFYFWRDTQDREAAERRDAAIRTSAVAAECRQLVEDASRGRNRDLTVGHMVACVQAGALTTADLRASGLNGAADAVDEHIKEFGLN